MKIPRNQNRPAKKTTGAHHIIAIRNEPEKSETRPISGEEMASPKMWQAKIEIAMAIVRSGIGTDSKINILIGLVGRKNSSCVTDMREINQ